MEFFKNALAEIQAYERMLQIQKSLEAEKESKRIERINASKRSELFISRVEEIEKILSETEDRYAKPLLFRLYNEGPSSPLRSEAFRMRFEHPKLYVDHIKLKVFKDSNFYGVAA